MKVSVQFFCSFFIPILFSSCSEYVHTISFSCEKDKKDNYVLKWEVYPERDSAKIEIFSSDNDSVFYKYPAKTTYVNDYIAVMPPTGNFVREYFKLKVGGTLSGVISNRVFEMDSLPNFRDAGGYFTKTKKQVRWGKIYRSANLSMLTEKDISILRSLDIKTVIDMRSEKQAERTPDMFKGINYVQLPIDVNNFDQAVKTQILEGRFLKGDAHVYTQDCYRIIIDKYAPKYAQLFDILSDEQNYPLIFHCGYGKDRTGLASYFLLKVLDVSEDVIEDDYLLTNNYLPQFRNAPGNDTLSQSVQDAITMLSRADLSHLKYAISCMKKKSGSVEEYMTNELNLTSEKKMKLKNILLYK